MRKIYLFLLTLLCAVGASAQVSFDTSKTYYLIENSTGRAVATGVNGADGTFGLAAGGATGDEFVLTPAGNGFVITNTKNQSLGNTHSWNTTNYKTIWVIEASETENGRYTLKAYNTAKQEIRYLNYQPNTKTTSIYADATAADNDHKLLFQFQETGNTPHAIVYKYQIDGAVKRYTRHFVEAGSAFPTIELPKGITSESQPSGNVAESDYGTEKVIDCTVTDQTLFETASTVAGITKWYAVKINPNDASKTKYLKSNASNQVAVTDAAIDYLNADAYLWGFVGDAFGVKMVNKATGKAVVSTGSDAVSLRGEPEYSGTAFIYVSSKQSGDIFCLKHPDMAKYLNGPQSNLLQHYTSNDGGSSFKLIETSDAEMVSGIKSALQTLLPSMESEIGKPGYVSQTAWDNAKTLAQSDGSTFEQLNEAKARLYTDVALPTAGKFYRIQNESANAYLVSGTGTDKAQFEAAAADAKNNVFYYDGTRLLSYDNGYYLSEKNYSGKPFVNYTETLGEGAATTFTFAASPVYGKLLIKFSNGSRALYSAGKGASNAAGNENTGQHYRFAVTEVEWLPVPMNTNEGYGYATLYSPVQLGLGDGSDRVEVYTVSSAAGTTATLSNKRCVPANTGVILKYKEGIQSNGCVYLPIQATTETSVTSLLSGSLADKLVGEDAYVLSKPAEGTIGLYKANKNQSENTWLNQGFHAYLPADHITGIGGARVLTFNFDDNAETGISAVEIEEAAPANAAIYDLSGRRVQSAKSGLYIINGKKVIK